MAHIHQSNLKRIWVVFGILSVITTVEVFLGILKPTSLHHSSFFGASILNWIFIVLTLVKAYYIAWAFMHLEGEKKWFRRTIVWPLVIYICYIMALLLNDGNYLNEILGPLVKW